MERDYTEEQKFIKARKRVEEIKGFYTHIVVTILIIPFLVFINLKFVPQFHWFWFPIFGWGLGLTIQAFRVFVDDGGFGRSWEKRKIGYPAWIRTMTKGTKNHCATITPPDRPPQQYCCRRSVQPQISASAKSFYLNTISGQYSYFISVFGAVY